VQVSPVRLRLWLRRAAVLLAWRLRLTPAAVRAGALLWLSSSWLVRAPVQVRAQVQA